MPWKETSAMNERIMFIGDYLREEYTVSDLCRSYGISRKTAYKWIHRYEQEELDGLRERSRAPHHQVHAVRPEIEDLIVNYRTKHMAFGPKKIRVNLRKEHPGIENWPAVSTIGEILKRHNFWWYRENGRSPVGVRASVH